ncbi:MAG: asparagine synthase (glutamine-hydrolyzing) [Candidatus Delongbacteria bacterium]|nr:asparagine synthase (glutamine-hydrolyzing) [Candidatus Delongbacteria bacterium]MBN2835814.1 asparagine synthase (glutamine-hydrolyzing) [Candidatus Delongbacteria bacterium]
MCGFIGAYSPVGNIGQDLIYKIVSLEKEIITRGPDKRGIFCDEKNFMIHRRLSIISPKNGNQPLNNDKYSLVYNGEIYNFKDLNKSLNRSYNSDTEMLFELLKVNGANCLDRLDGMFALAFSGEQSIILARDPAGQKPLYYSIIGNTIIYSSSIKVVAELGKGKIDKTVVVFSMMYGSLRMGNRTIFENVFSVEPGSFIQFSVNGLENTKYIEFERSRKYYDLDLQQAEQKMDELLSESVKKRLLSDVPLGGFLSGGLDSSAISYYAKQFKNDYRTFSISYGLDETGENYHAEITAKKLGIKHTSLLFDNTKLAGVLEYLISIKGVPLSTPNEAAIYKLSQLVSNDLTVILSGEGADELLYGYSHISRGAMDYIRNEFKNYLKSQTSFQLSMERLYTDLVYYDEQDLFQFYFRRINFQNLALLLDEKFDLLKISKEINAYFELLFKKYNKLDIYDRWQAIVFDINLSSLLDRLDFNTMLGSVEGRTPFLDKKLVDFAINIPRRFKLKTQVSGCFCHKNSQEFTSSSDTTKFLLRQIMKDRLPEEIIKRPKFSFPVPYRSFTQDSAIQDIITCSKLSKNKIFSPNKLVDYFRFSLKDSSGFTSWIIKNYTDFSLLI